MEEASANLLFYYKVFHKVLLMLLFSLHVKLREVNFTDETFDARIFSYVMRTQMYFLDLFVNDDLNIFSIFKKIALFFQYS